jgi:hypothetical protein
MACAQVESLGSLVKVELLPGNYAICTWNLGVSAMEYQLQLHDAINAPDFQDVVAACSQLAADGR